MEYPHQRIMARNDALGFVFQRVAHLEESVDLIEGIALIVTGRPHLFDVRVPVDRVSRDCKRTVMRSHHEKLCTECVCIFRQVRGDTREDLFLATDEPKTTC